MQLPVLAEAGATPRLEPGRGAGLCDAQGRRITYLRLSVTDRCNLRCTYCSPASWGGTAALLSRAELARLGAVFAGLGVSRIRLTGGEPLYRKDLPAIAADLKALPGIRQLALTTNGVFLRRQAQALVAAGVDQVNLSLDSLDPARFAALSGGGTLAEVEDGLAAALEAGFPTVKLNVVVVAGVNEDEVVPLARYAWARGIVPRYIECMPFREGRPVATDALLARFAEAGEPLVEDGLAEDGPRGPAAYYRAPGGGRVGFIGSMTRNFCAGCNRVRVGPSGNLRACLGGREEIALGPLLRGGASDAAIGEAIRGALLGKPDGHRFTDEDAGKALLTMMGIGG